MVAPAAYPLIATLAGTLLGWSVPHGRGAFLACLLVLAPAALAVYLVRRRRRWKGACLLVCLLLAAALRTSQRLDPDLPSTHLVRHADGTPVLLEGVVCSPPVKGPTFTLIPLESCRLRSAGGGIRPTEGRVDLVVSGRADAVRIGDVLLAEVRLRLPRNWGNPGEFDRRRRSFLRGVYVRGSVSDAARLFCLGTAEGFGFRRWVEGLREGIAGFLDREPDVGTRGLLKAWLLGDRSEIPPATDAAFRRSGLAHLNAVSGLQVSLVALLVCAGLRALARCFSRILVLGWADRAAAAAGIPFVVLYVFLTDCPVTAVRAGLMAALVAGSLVLGRAHAGWNGLALASLVIVLWDPAALFSVSFQLSFAAMAGILLALSRWFAPPWRRAVRQEPGPEGTLRRIERAAWVLLLVSLAALLATAPLTAVYFNRVTPLALLPNLVAVPLVSWVATPAGLAAAVLSPVSRSLAGALLGLAGAATRLTVAVAQVFSRVPGACLVTGTPTLPEILLFYAALLLLCRRSGSKWRGRMVAACLAGVILLIVPGVIRQRWGRWLEISYLSVGDGDCALIELPGGTRMLVDGGFAREGLFDAGQTVVAPYLGYRRICRVDLLVVSHGQADHYGGLRSIAEAYRPRELWIGPATGNEEAGYGDFLDFCRARGIRIRSCCRQANPVWIHGASLEFLHPPCEAEPESRWLRGAAARGVNNASLVIRLTYGAARFLFTGDLEREGEEMLRAWKGTFPADLLKVPHHGSRTSSTGALLDGVNPRAAVVSLGQGNRFGFPAPGLPRACEARGISLYRTDVDGAVRVRTDGNRIEVRSPQSGRVESWRCPELRSGVAVGATGRRAEENARYRSRSER